MQRMKIVDGKIGEGVGFDRIRRITGYLVGTLDRFNDAKKAEEADRVKHESAVIEPAGAATEPAGFASKELTNSAR